MSTSACVNVHHTASGGIRPVCEFCGRRGRAIGPDHVSDRRHLDLFELGRGWSVAPYPPDFVHHDGSTGDQFTCPACNARLNRGEGLRSRAYLLDPDEHQSALRAAERAKAALRERGAMD